MVKTASGEITLPHSCPCPKYGCMTTATDYPSLQSLFGFRTIREAVKNQSWCIECRKKALKESRDKKKKL
ncbi:hypothetical protein KKI93_03710 [Xenorhabdus bovienii]|uniref:hypothetical protein n=1 Tax=Xenorhabdus TaxID=626 RepID=UPI001F2D9FD6|nr:MULTISPECIES: hypothetical protein [Xenorhabdus]MDE9483037.1 hypothetical protein [Xenorhabdus bovienii]MDE9563198.1 hypothetical protein [Xenorhabdus bovienii]